MNGPTRLHWTRILLGALLLEAVLILVLAPIGETFGSPFAQNADSRVRDPTIFLIAVPTACFVFGYLITRWLMRKVSVRLVLHGTLIGVAATALYFALVAAQPGGLAAAVAGYGPVLFYLTQGLRIGGCIAGAAHAARTKATTAQTVTTVGQAR